jgi:triphosphoribosyl-dephospho-CoA synthase
MTMKPPAHPPHAEPNVGDCATLACLIEATVPKPGNVHRGADFEYLTFWDFQAAAVAIGPAMQQAADGGRVGTAILAATQRTRQWTNLNVNLGIVLLLAPLAAATRHASLREGVRTVLAELDDDDAARAYDAIRLANPGGLGHAPEADVAEAPPAGLVEAMRLAEDRDTIARQYANDFGDVFELVVPELQRGLARGWSLGEAVIRTFLRTMHERPDTHIARKCGLEAAQQAAAWAGSVLAAGEPGDDEYHAALADLDFELRADGNRRNPGTTADLLAAGLFVALHDRMIAWPVRL